MKRFLLVLSLTGALAGAADLDQVRSVYVMSMAHGLDQYLANRLTGSHLFQVVTDPARADAVFTDRVGEGFESQLGALMPVPQGKDAKEPKEAKDAKDAKDAKASDSSTPSLLADTANKLSNPALNSAFGRSRGTIFLVDRDSRRILWSVYRLPKSSNSSELDRIASDIVSRLKQDLNKQDSGRQTAKKN
jgi:hypothetical protein